MSVGPIADRVEREGGADESCERRMLTECCGRGNPMWCQHCGAYLAKGQDKCPGCDRPRAEAIPQEAHPRALSMPVDPGPSLKGVPAAPRNWPGGPPPPPPTPPYGKQPPSAMSHQRGSGAPHFDPYGRPGGPRSAGLRRRGLLQGGVIGVVGALLGGAAVSTFNSLTTSKPSLMVWACVDGNTLKLFQNGSSTILSTYPIPAGLRIVTSRTLSANYLAAVATVNSENSILSSLGLKLGTWGLIWELDKIASPLPATLPPPTEAILLSAQPGQGGKVYDVRVVTDQSGIGVAVAVALSNGGGAPQVVFSNLPKLNWRQPLVRFNGGAVSEVSFVGPTNLVSGNTLYVRITSGDSVQTVPVNVNTPTPTPAPTQKPLTSPTVTAATPSPSAPPKLNG